MENPHTVTTEVVDQYGVCAKVQITYTGMALPSWTDSWGEYPLLMSGVEALRGVMYAIYGGSVNFDEALMDMVEPLIEIRDRLAKEEEGDSA